MTTIANSTSAFYERSTMDIASLRARAESLQSQISSGSRLARSSDNPVAASRLRTLSRSSELATVDTSNANRASADLKLADTALSSFAEFVTRARELTDEEVEHVVAEADALYTESEASLSGVSPQDVDLTGSYDAFTFTTMLQLEDYGFCKKGDRKSVV